MRGMIEKMAPAASAAEEREAERKRKSSNERKIVFLPLLAVAAVALFLAVDYLDRSYSCPPPYKYCRLSVIEKLVAVHP